MRPGVKGTCTSIPRILRGLFDGRAAAKDDQIGQRDLLAAGRALNVLLDGFELLQHDLELGGLVHGPILLRS